MYVNNPTHIQLHCDDKYSIDGKKTLNARFVLRKWEVVLRGEGELPRKKGAWVELIAYLENLISNPYPSVLSNTAIRSNRVDKHTHYAVVPVARKGDP